MREMPRAACALGTNAVGMLHPLSWTHREENRKPPTICHQHLRDSSTCQGIAHVGTDGHFTPGPCHRALSIIPGRHRSTQGKMGLLVRWSFAAWSKDRDGQEFPGLCPHPFPISAASWDAGRARGDPAPASCPAGALLRWEMGGGAVRTASSLRRVISCHRVPDPELWLRPGGSKRSR